jgi:hypothetical protein
MEIADGISGGFPRSGPPDIPSGGFIGQTDLATYNFAAKAAPRPSSFCRAIRSPDGRFDRTRCRLFCPPWHRKPRRRFSTSPVPTKRVSPGGSARCAHPRLRAPGPQLPKEPAGRSSSVGACAPGFRIRASLWRAGSSSKSMLLPNLCQAGRCHETMCFHLLEILKLWNFETVFFHLIRRRKCPKCATR